MFHAFYVVRLTMILHGQVLGIAQIAEYSYAQNVELVAINVQNVRNIASIKQSQHFVISNCGLVGWMSKTEFCL